MISEQFAEAQIMRLESMPGHPQTKAGWRELVNTLRGTTANEQHARSVIDDLTRGDRCPGPGTIRQAAYESRPEAPQRAVGCSLCGGSGTQVVEHWRQERQYVRQPDGTRAEQLVWLSGARPCPRCRAGAGESAA